jgi:hypothetical protein
MDLISRCNTDHLRRNQSIMVDLFHGQLKNQLRCLTCDHVSVTFDPFTFLTLPLPAESTTNVVSHVLESGCVQCLSRVSSYTVVHIDSRETPFTNLAVPCLSNILHFLHFDFSSIDYLFRTSSCRGKTGRHPPITWCRSATTPHTVT